MVTPLIIENERGRQAVTFNTKSSRWWQTKTRTFAIRRPPKEPIESGGMTVPEDFHCPPSAVFPSSLAGLGQLTQSFCASEGCHCQHSCEQNA
jgi:hypothetical protein